MTEKNKLLFAISPKPPSGGFFIFFLKYRLFFSMILLALYGYARRRPLYMTEYLDRELILENKIALLNRLSNFYKVSSLFFNLRSDMIITANEQYAEDSSGGTGGTMGRILAERIKRIIENTNLLESAVEDGSENSRKKNELKKKLIRLTMEKE